LEKVLKGLKKDLQKTVQQYCDERTTAGVDMITVSKSRTHEHIDVESVKSIMQERILEADEIKEQISNIHAEIIVKGYKEIPDILDQYPTETVQTFVVMQKVALGEYDPEKDNVDQYTRQQLIDMAVELNQAQFRQRMISQGKGQISDKQVDAIKKLCEQLGTVVDMPKDKFSASELIEKLTKQLPKKETVMIGNITEPQFKRLQWMSNKLGYAMPQCKDKKEASDLIQKYQAELDAHPEFISEPATHEQVEYVKRLLKLLNKRWTAKREEEYTAMTKAQISKAIKELQVLIPEERNASEGQVQYIVSLCTRMNLPHSVEQLKTISKEEATKTIDKLNRDYLYILSKANGTLLRKEDIAVMPANAVKELLAQINMERKTMFYTKSSEEVM
jgi:CRISPR/Cas system-associated protein endoribonuclease Cas2